MTLEARQVQDDVDVQIKTLHVLYGGHPRQSPDTEKEKPRLDPVQSLCANLLIEAINEFLLTPARVLRRQANVRIPDMPKVVDTCKPTCPLLDHLFRDKPADSRRLMTCERMKALNRLDEFPAWAWMLSNSQDPLSFAWCCQQLAWNPAEVLLYVQALPKGRPLEFNGRRLYRHNTASYDVSHTKRGAHLRCRVAR